MKKSGLIGNTFFLYSKRKPGFFPIFLQRYFTPDSKERGQWLCNIQRNEISGTLHNGHKDLSVPLVLQHTLTTQYWMK